MRFYILFIIVLGNALWMFTYFSNLQWIRYYDLKWVIYMLLGAAVCDVFVIKPKNFKYLCKSFVKSDHDDDFKKVKESNAEMYLQHQ